MLSQLSIFDVLLLQGDARMQSHLCHNFLNQTELRNLGTTKASLMRNPKCSTKSLDYRLCGYYPCMGGCTTANTPHNNAQKVLSKLKGLLQSKHLGSARTISHSKQISKNESLSTRYRQCNQGMCNEWRWLLDSRRLKPMPS